MPKHRRTWSRSTKIASTLLTLAGIGLAGGAATYAAFSETTQNGTNTFAAGTVTLGDNDSGTQMFSLSNLKPGDRDEACITVVYSGSLPATVRMYGTTGGTGLDRYLTLKVVRGSYTSGPASDSCAGFSPDATEYLGAGAGAGVVYNGSLEDFADAYATALVDPPSPSPESWTSGESHVYKFEVTQQDDNSAKSLTATQTFAWEARNV